MVEKIIKRFKIGIVLLVLGTLLEACENKNQISIVYRYNEYITVDFKQKKYIISCWDDYSELPLHISDKDYGLILDLYEENDIDELDEIYATDEDKQRMELFPIFSEIIITKSNGKKVYVSMEEGLNYNFKIYNQKDINVIQFNNCIIHILLKDKNFLKAKETLRLFKKRNPPRFLM